jgi:hypothetical protein
MTDPMRPAPPSIEEGTVQLGGDEDTAELASKEQPFEIDRPGADDHGAPIPEAPWERRPDPPRRLPSERPAHGATAAAPPAGAAAPRVPAPSPEIKSALYKRFGKPTR